MYNNIKALICLAITGLLGISCADTADIENRLNDLEGRLDNIEATVSGINADINALSSLAKEGIFIVGKTDLEHGYRLELSTTEESQTIEVTYGEEVPNAVPVFSIDADGNWLVSTDGGTNFSPVEGADNAHNPEGNPPQVMVDDENYWCISYDGVNYTRILKNGEPISATSGIQAGGITGIFTNVVFNESTGNMDFTLANGTSFSVPVIETFYMNVLNFADGQKILLNETIVYEVEMSDVKSAAIPDIPGWHITLEDTQLTVTAPSTGTESDCIVRIYLVSNDNLLKTVSLVFHLVPTPIDANACKEWNDFVAGNDDNVLLDFSYAGYMHGETGVPAVTVSEGINGECTTNLAGYKVYNIRQYGAVGNGTDSDRDAFIAMLTDALGEPTMNGAGDQLTFPHSNQPRNVIFYFPEGNYVLHTEADNNFEQNKSVSILIRGSNIILKGAGRDKTTLTMAAENLPSQGELVMYSSPDMIQLKHNTGIQTSNVLATVTGTAEKGAFSVEVADAGKLTADDWVCLYLKNNSPEVVTAELAPYEAGSNWTIAGSEGVVVKDLHQIKSVSGNTVTFHEPIMHEIDPSWNWTIVNYQHYENVGVEDMTFAGNAKEKFDHHLSWHDDGGYKPISITRVVNSWMRRVDFVSVSEACSIIESANVSVYDCGISGTRGHAAIRSQASSRVFIGAVTDKSEGYFMDNLGHDVTDNYGVAGQYHAVGVSKESMGAVLWRNKWGDDSCFEAHASQPRATLIDCCEGALIRWRQGGADTEMPNHLADLMLWNFDNTVPFSGTWIWWDNGSSWWKFLPPVIVGFHGEAVNFDPSQTKVNSSYGTEVTPGSLYEAQLRNRLGFVPGWLNELKGIAPVQ